MSSSSSWLDLVEDIRGVIRHLLDDASLASLRMTCSGENEAQGTWFQQFPVSPRCHWVIADDRPELILVRPRRNFVLCCKEFRYDRLRLWAIAEMGYREALPPSEKEIGGDNPWDG